MNFTIEPWLRFAISIFVTLAIGVTQGAVSLTDAIPADWIKPVVAWFGIFAFVGSAANTAISGLGMTSQSRISAAASLPQVTKIVATPEVAATVPSTKVVAP